MKLLKLTITMFQGTHLDWLQFWNQFETEITQVAKFSYLKELLNIPKICSVADGLPCNTEGYEHVKAILYKAKYRRLSKIAFTHMQCIITLSAAIHGSQPARV